MKIMMVFLVLMSFARLEANQYDFYQERYNLQDVYTKLLNNHGEGFEELYGLRNFRSILKGFLYRGGANNKFHRDNRRDNMNPLPDDGLQNLCKEGFSKAVYLYNTRFDTAPKKTHCTSIHGKENTLEYINLVTHRSSELTQILEIVHQAIVNQDAPIYLHCWNGWHASGLISAISLKQFCGFQNDELVEYWDRNTDGFNTDPRYESIRNKIRRFEPISKLSISKEMQERLCPQSL